MAWTTADLYDAHPDDVSVPELQWLNIGARARFHGPVATLKLFEDNALVRDAFAEVGEEYPDIEQD